MLRIEEVYARKKEAAAQVSTQTRTLAFGFLGVSWALLTVHDEPLKSMASHVPPSLILSLAAASIVVLALDMCQYVAVTSMADTTYRKAEETKQKEDIVYESESFAYKAHVFFYRVKFWVLAVAALLLLIIFGVLFMPIHPK